MYSYNDSKTYFPRYMWHLQSDRRQKNSGVSHTHQHTTPPTVQKDTLLKTVDMTSQSVLRSNEHRFFNTQTKHRPDVTTLLFRPYMQPRRDSQGLFCLEFDGDVFETFLGSQDDLFCTIHVHTDAFSSFAHAHRTHWHSICTPHDGPGLCALTPLKA